MINTKIKFIFMLFLLQASHLPLFAQNRSVLPFLTDQQSPLLLGAGSIGTAIPNNDVLGFYYNPANLGYISRTTNLAFLFTPTVINKMRYVNHKLNTFSFMGGYNFNKSNSLPFSIGFAYSKYSNLGPRNNDDCFTEIILYNNSVKTYSLGIGFEYYININVGFSYKEFDSDGKVLFGYEIGKPGLASGTAFDLGTLITIPLTRLLKTDYSFNLGKCKISPEINFSLGYSQLNIGDEFYYIDKEQADPIPRTARTGYSINIGFNTELNMAKLRVLDYSFTAEANDLLIKEENPNIAPWDRKVTYQSFLGDINYWDNVIMLKPDQNVLVHKGHIIKLFESITLTFGSYSGRKEPKHTSYGFGFSTKGISKLFNNIIGNDILAFISNHMVIEFYTSNVKNIYWYPKQESTLEYNTNYQGISVALTNIEL